MQSKAEIYDDVDQSRIGNVTLSEFYRKLQKKEILFLICDWR